MSAKLLEEIDAYYEKKDPYIEQLQQAQARLPQLPKPKDKQTRTSATDSATNMGDSGERFSMFPSPTEKQEEVKALLEQLEAAKIKDGQEKKEAKK